MSDLYIIGVDEAGMGAAIGPIVLTAIAVRDNDTSYLEQVGVRDSKKFCNGAQGRRQRAKMYYKIRDIVGPENISCVQFSAREVADYMSAGEKLPLIEHQLARSAILNLFFSLNNSNLRNIIFDGTQQFKEFNASSIPVHRANIIREDKADSKYIQVAAASVIAKHIRDTDTRKIMRAAFSEGAGYPNEHTREWIERNPELATPYIRYTWAWCRRVLSKKTRKKIEEIIGKKFK